MTTAGKSVLVTGADGFIGSHLVEALVRDGAKVRALAYYNSFNSWGWLDDVLPLEGVEVITGDVRDQAFCRGLIEGVDLVFHLAALIAIPYSYVAPESYVQTNVGGTLNVCLAAKAAKCSRVIITSTSEVYGTARRVPIDETHPLQPQSPYSASKIGADAMAMSFHHAFGLPVVLARPFNTYGPRQSARAVIPTIISQLAVGRQRISLGETRVTRDFTFVEDTCRGMIALAGADEAIGQVVNIGSGFEISVADLFDKICGAMGRRAELVRDESRLRPAGSEVERLWCDAGKLRAMTGFTPSIDLDTGLGRTAEWFGHENNRRRYKADIFNV